MEPLRALAALVGMSDEWNQADGETFEAMAETMVTVAGIRIEY